MRLGRTDVVGPENAVAPVVSFIWKLRDRLQAVRRGQAQITCVGDGAKPGHKKAQR